MYCVCHWRWGQIIYLSSIFLLSQCFPSFTSRTILQLRRMFVAVRSWCQYRSDSKEPLGSDADPTLLTSPLLDMETKHGVFHDSSQHRRYSQSESEMSQITAQQFEETLESNAMGVSDNTPHLSSDAALDNGSVLEHDAARYSTESRSVTQAHMFSSSRAFSQRFFVEKIDVSYGSNMVGPLDTLTHVLCY